ILKKPELASEIDSAALGKLLPTDLLDCLEKQYLETQQNELSTYMNRVLEEEIKTWTRREQPPREDGCYTSPLAYDIIQGSQEDWLKEILTNIAEMLKLQHIPALQMQIVSMGHAYPDLR
ncbi:hypothetical protein GOODEAATRI_022729, partial [Goodea atripinnis]